MSRIILLCCCYLCLTATIFAQKPADWKRTGENAFENGRWATAKTLLSQYQEAKPGDFGVLTKLGITHYHLGQGVEAKRFLEYVAAKSPDSRDPNLYYYLASTLHGLGEWDKAIAAYKSFLKICGEKHVWRHQASDNIRRCVQGMRAQDNQEVALVENLGAQVNSAGDEFAPLPSVNYTDRMYYAAAREGCKGGLRNEEGYDDPDRGRWSSDMFVAQLRTSGWEAAGGLGGLLNSSRFEVPLGFNNNGQILYFFRGFTTHSGEILSDTAAKKDEYALIPPTFKSSMEPENGDVAPYFFNEKTILFASRRAGGHGGLDLWFTVFVDTAWSAPVNLGPSVNSAYDETTPFLARDGRTLYFSSNRVESMGGLDIYKSIFDEKKLHWQNPVNLGIPVNSPKDDTYYRLNSDGSGAFLASDRFGGFGEKDLYFAYFKEEATAQMTKSQPEFFDQVGVQGQQPEVARVIRVPAMLYDTDRDLSSTDNLKIAQQVAAQARQHPEATVLVTVFTNDSGQPKFDLYTGIKRAEILGKVLTERGVPAGNITLRSVGAAYPLARTILDGTENLEAKRLNRRIECTFTTVDQPSFEILLERPEVSELMATDAVKRLDEQNRGLSFKVEAAVTRQILANDALSTFGELMIETQPGAGSYRYSAGHFKQFEKAAQLRKELQGLGFYDAIVVAYINGIRVSKAEAVGLLKKYPDITPFIKS